MLDSAHVIVNNGEGDLEAYTCKSYCSHIVITVIKRCAGKFIALAITIRFSFHY